MSDPSEATKAWDADRSLLSKGAGLQVGGKAEQRHRELFLAHSSAQGPGYMLPKRKYRA